MVIPGLRRTILIMTTSLLQETITLIQAQQVAGQEIILTNHIIMALAERYRLDLVVGNIIRIVVAIKYMSPKDRIRMIFL